jgi:hypothetical protein
VSPIAAASTFAQPVQIAAIRVNGPHFRPESRPEIPRE